MYTYDTWTEVHFRAELTCDVCGKTVTWVGKDNERTGDIRGDWRFMKNPFPSQEVDAPYVVVCSRACAEKFTAERLNEAWVAS